VGKEVHLESKGWWKIETPNDRVAKRRMKRGKTQGRKGTRVNRVEEKGKDA